MTLGGAAARNVVGGPLEPCSTEPLTGFHRDGSCDPTGEPGVGHSLCAVMTQQFLDQQRSVGNDLVTPRLEWAFSGLRPGDRWCVLAERWLQAESAGCAPPVVLAATHERTLAVVDLEVLRRHAVDVPDDPRALATD